MRDQHGFALVTVLMVVAVLMILGTSMMYVQALEMRQTLRQEQQVQAHYLARSGLEVGLKYLEEQSEKAKEFKDLKLDTPLSESIPGAGSYQVTFEAYDVSSDGHSVDILSTGTVFGRTRVEETIKLTVKVQSSVEYASEINWFQKDGEKNVHKFIHEPSKRGNPVILKAASHKIMTDGDHFFEAPAMKFGEMERLEIKNKETLTLTSDVVLFDCKVSIAGALVLKTRNPVTFNDAEYGIVYFDDSVFTNNENKSFPISKGYYLFSNGTRLEDEKITGVLKPLKNNDPLLSQVPSVQEGLVVYPHRYAAGASDER